MTTFSPTQTAPDTIVIPNGRIGRFIAEREIGQGSVGTVYQFRDPLIGRKLAIKVLKPQISSEESRVFEKHFIQEARAAGRLNHPNIVTVYDADKSGDLLYIAMEYLDGKELRDVLASGHRFTHKQIADMVARIANALDYAHQNGVIHRDIKPANIFIVGKYTPKVLDFGIASASRQITDQDTTIGYPTLSGRRLIGTPSYMSPEQTRAEIVDARTDIFSLGVVLYQLLCGELPFKGETIQDLMESIEYDAPVPPQDIRPGVPHRLAYIAGKAIAKKPSDRYASAAEMANDLNRYLAKERTNQILATLRNPETGKIDDIDDENAGGTTATPPADKASYRRPNVIGISVFVAIVAIGAVIFVSHKAADRKAAPPIMQAESSKASSARMEKPVAPKPMEPAVVVAVKVDPVEEPAAKKADPKAAKPEAKGKPKAKAAGRARPSAVPAMGKVMVAVAPWGEVFVDGKSRGVTPPLTQLTLPAGPHSVEIRNGDERHNVKIMVSTDKETKIGHRF